MPSLRIVIVTPGITAPLPSCTVPTIAPVFAWPNAAAVPSSSTRTTLAPCANALAHFNLIGSAFLVNDDGPPRRLTDANATGKTSTRTDYSASETADV